MHRYEWTSLLAVGRHNVRATRQPAGARCSACEGG